MKNENLVGLGGDLTELKVKHKGHNTSTISNNNDEPM
jgi:hypothetical protein